MKTLEHEREISPTVKKIQKINRLLDGGLKNKGKKIKRIAERYEMEKEDRFRNKPTIEATLKVTNYEKVSKDGSEYIRVCAIGFEERHTKQAISTYTPVKRKYQNFVGLNK